MISYTKFVATYYENCRQTLKKPIFFATSSIYNQHFLPFYTPIDKILALVVYTGRETRMAMNSREARSKMGRIDCEINSISKLLFLMMALLSALLVLLAGVTPSWFLIVQFNRYLILLSNIIPISMRVNLDFAKLLYCWFINNDDQIKGTVARSSQIPEELGRIEYLLSDKTGTLTQNDMIFKRLSLEHGNYTHEDVKWITEQVRSDCQASEGPLADVAERAGHEAVFNSNSKN
jgi:phospholipid-translocating ATPase